ncbi:hypothetical protein GBK02_14890 [Dechloromonas sp. TW-R-39-2]|uniref:hypothetical protein n=1 Tax=Dechloromonas sp. TW-R-39-2 TaxID=2654218 RepID=UPI00193CD57C|nr:hypothetical protein [Dechloromonas sp. TW-R-39-2]QRM20577.1 hypothetical protein GBK02_14890 [Dechloromonas sp. TW-R-39-2]
MNRNELVDVQQQAATALSAGARLAARAANMRSGQGVAARPSGAELGALLSNPSAFWAGAVAVESYGDGDTVQSLALASKYAAAQLAVGDLGFVRESLLGQSQWLSVMAVKLMQRAEGERHEQAVGLMKLALSAQRQAAATMATAAALNKLQPSPV